MSSDRAIELIRELKRAKESIAPFNVYTQEGVLQVINEIKYMFENNKNVMNSGPRKRPYVFVNHLGILRRKRCVLSYLLHRLRQVQQLRYQLGSGIPEQLRDNLNPEECTVFSQYTQLLAKYMNDVDVDIAFDMDYPPKDLFIEVKGIENSGDVYTESGVVSLKKNVVQYVKRDPEIDALIHQGILEHIK